MKFKLQDNARKVSEKQVGMSCEEQQLKSLDTQYGEYSRFQGKVPCRQIKPRGSIYLVTERKVSMDMIKKIIRDF